MSTTLSCHGIKLHSGIRSHDIFEQTRDPYDIFVTLPLPADLVTPKSVQDVVLDSVDYYVIRTRIVIDITKMEQIDPESDISTEIIASAKSIDNAVEDLKFIESHYFKDVALKFHIISVEVVEYSIDYHTRWVDACLHPDCLSIYYMLPNSMPHAGMGSPPWNKLNTGVLIAYGERPDVLAHEIGHYFGLLHTFNDSIVSGDEVEDTPLETSMCYNPWTGAVCEEGVLKNCHNLMNYCMHTLNHERFITDGQKERMLRFIRTSRRNHLMFSSKESVFD